MQWIDNSQSGIYSKRRSIKPASPSQNANLTHAATINKLPNYKNPVMGFRSKASTAAFVGPSKTLKPTSFASYNCRGITSSQI